MREMNDFVPFHKVSVSEREVSLAVEAIKSGWWTSGPNVKRFEEEFAELVGTKHAVAVNSWTGAAHLTLEALGLQAGDEVIVPAITFTATAEIVCYFDAKPVVVDVDAETGLIDIEAMERSITPKTKGIIPVHYGGQVCDMDSINVLAKKHNLFVLEDAAHAIPSYYKGNIVGNLSDVTCFSFYATKPLACGEGGMITTDRDDIAERCSIMRLHGMNRDAWKRYTAEGKWYYEVIAPGYKYNLTDIHAALGLAQLERLYELHIKRKDIAAQYNRAFSGNEYFQIPKILSDSDTSWHLYWILLNQEKLTITRAEFIDELTKHGVGSSVHFIPLYLHPYYRDTFQLSEREFPNANSFYSREISLPIFPDMSKEQVSKVTKTVMQICQEFAK